jgi:hypothetical protein
LRLQRIIHAPSAFQAQFLRGGVAMREGEAARRRAVGAEAPGRRSAGDGVAAVIG